MKIDKCTIPLTFRNFEKNVKKIYFNQHTVHTPTFPRTKYPTVAHRVVKFLRQRAGDALSLLHRCRRLHVIARIVVALDRTFIDRMLLDLPRSRRRRRRGRRGRRLAAASAANAVTAPTPAPAPLSATASRATASLALSKTCCMAVIATAASALRQFVILVIPNAVGVAVVAG